MPKSSKRSDRYSHSAVIRYARMLGFGNIHHRMDSATGLDAIIAVHNVDTGPSIGGCRFFAYGSYNQALLDALKLSSMMTYKNAACGLPHGGGKAVIIEPSQPYDREALFKSFGDFVNDLQGDYITAMDIGVTTADMDTIATRTPHVIGSVGTDVLQEDPSPYTARGLIRGIEAAVKFKLGLESLAGLTVAIQGLGKVGYNLALSLHKKGVKLIVADTNPTVTAALVEKCQAKVVGTDEIAEVNCDIFSPCAVGGTLSAKAVSKFKASIIAGSANNQLAHFSVANMLQNAGILYVPDLVVNSGGVIQAAYVHDYHDISIANKKIDDLYSRLYMIFERAQKEKTTPTHIAYQIARENLTQAKQQKAGPL